jgi:hypothetical protein
MIRYIEDQFLARLQKRCSHPGNLVAVDILDGCGSGVEVSYCNRCGAVRTNWNDQPHPDNAWRRPDPNLWRG